MDRPGGALRPSFVEGAGARQGHERGVEGGGEVVEAQELFLGG
jgi:hypothetical protein